MAVIVAFARPARSEPSEAQAEAQAETLFRQGRALMAAGKLTEACNALAESEKLAPAPATLLNLAGCREKRGEFATAWGMFLEVERKLREATERGSRDLHASALAHARKLEQRVSRLTIIVPATSRIEGLAITRDGEPVDGAQWDRAVPVDGGNHEIAARGPGKEPWSKTVSVRSERDSSSVEVPVLRDAPPTPADAASLNLAEPARAHAASDTVEVQVAQRPSLFAPLTIGGVAVVLGAGALYFELDGRDIYDQAKAEQSSQLHRDALYDRAGERYYIAQGLFAGSIACAAVTAWLLLRSGDSTPAKRDHAFVLSPHGAAFVGAF